MIKIFNPTNRLKSKEAGARGRAKRVGETVTYSEQTAPMTNEQREANYRKQNLLIRGTERLTIKQQRTLRRNARKEVSA